MAAKNMQADRDDGREWYINDAGTAILLTEDEYKENFAPAVNGSNYRRVKQGEAIPVQQSEVLENPDMANVMAQMAAGPSTNDIRSLRRTMAEGDGQ